MKIGILSAQTGKGHISVANALKKRFEDYAEVEVFPSFYEDLMVSNKIISDYYNFLMVNSTQLCHEFSRLSYITRPDLSETFYQGVEQSIKKFLNEHKFDKIISTSHTINHAVLRAIDELNLQEKPKYYIVVTDPFYPISVGFDAEGASKYYCSSDRVRDFLIQRGMKESKVVKKAYPVDDKFLKSFTEAEIQDIYKKYELSSKKRTILINSGSQGAFHYLTFLKEIIKDMRDLQVIFISGKNEALYHMACNAADGKEEQVKILGYVNNIEDFMRISDVCFTKPGANAFFECLSMQKPVIIDGAEGFLYQEKGVIEFLNERKVGRIITDFSETSSIIHAFFEKEIYEGYKRQLAKITVDQGAREIALDIWND